MNLGDFFVEVMHSCHQLAIQPAPQLLLLCCLEVPCHNLGPSILQHTGNVDRDNDYERGQRHRIHMRMFSLGCVFTTLNAQPIEAQFAQLLPTSIGSPPSGLGVFARPAHAEPRSSEMSALNRFI